MPGKHVIVGGLGNVGAHIQARLLAQGRAVCVVDRPNAVRSPVHSSVEFLPYMLGSDDTKILKEALNGAETVYSTVTPDVQHGTQREFNLTNNIGIGHLVAACREVGVPKLVYASSLAVTDHFIASKNQTESDPLPPVESYKTSYDLTKRLGEDQVLAAHDENLRTCALRLGGIIAGPRDYYLRHNMEMGEKSGKIYTVETKPIDTIAGRDVAKALVQAGKKLDENNDLGGSAVFVTKCRKDRAPSAAEVARHLAALMGWDLRILPNVVLGIMRTGTWMKYSVTSLFKDKEELPGIPPHLYMDIADYEQTFDNSLARDILDFRPDLSWDDAVEDAVKEYKDSKS